ncbi:MAG: SDR family NAD(P)-dependent oxidoreductase [Bacteroidales bacterium]|nr:SDR family NAD(P)-dependent oxidoreductase [Bacteroidales bacterium]
MEKSYAIITGASGSMGSVAVAEIASAGYPVVMACRNLEKGEAVRQKILKRVPNAELHLHKLDIGNIKSVIEFAEQMESGIAYLFNNAGVISRGYQLNQDGFENTMAVNYLGPYLLTRLLQNKMNEDAHIVNMVSLTHRYGKIRDDFFNRKKFTRLSIYSDTKLALLYFSIALASRVPQKVNVADPGIVNSNMISMGKWFDPIADALFRPFCKSPESGVKPALNALRHNESGFYFKGNGSAPIAEKYKKDGKAEWLWQRTEQLLQDRGTNIKNI